ncbi:MAG: SET domain-containing protein-lysine N-methyltransferase [Variovorax sp.]
MTPSSSHDLVAGIEELVVVRDSEIHGRGVFARRRLAPGTSLGLYEGRRYSPAALRRRSFDSALTYLFVLSDGTTIDGGQGGNATRHLNHACVPNCEACEEIAEDGSIMIRVMTVRPVARDSELFLDYALVIDASEEPLAYPCHCGHADCRGSMAALPPGSSP